MNSMSVLIALLVGLTAAYADNWKNPTSQRKHQHQHADDQKPSRRLIIHGETAAPGRYPYFTTFAHDCGGALIAPDMVLTAGHCKDRYLTAAVGRYSFAHDQVGKVVVGEESSTRSFAGYYDVIAQARHPLWIRKGDDEFEHDFLLLKLNQTLRDHPIVLLNDNPERPNSGDEVTAMGVGWTHFDRESRADTLREVQLNAISNEDCRVSKNEELSYRKRIFPSHVCTTGGENNDRDACAYDSGSPIILPGNNGDPDVLVALVSWGEGCADPDFPGVNARVSDAFEWLRVNVCVMSDDPPDYLCAPATEAPHEPVLPSIPSDCTTVEPDRWADIVWKTATVILGIVCAALLFERNRSPKLSRSISRKRFLDSPGSSIDEVECLNADGPHLNRYESLQGVEVSTFSVAP